MPKDDLDLTAVTEAVAEVKKNFETFKDSVSEEALEKKLRNAVDPLLTERLEKITEDLNEKQELIDKLYTQQRRKTIFVDGQQVDEDELDAKALNWAKLNMRRKGEDIADYGHEQVAEYKAAFLRYIRKDDKVLSGDESKALSVGSDPDGGYVVYPDMSGRIVTRLFETSPVRSYASVQLISTDALEGIHDVDEAASGWVSETGARTETATPQLDVWRIPVHEQYAEPRATQKLLDDAAIDMEAWLAAKVADKLARTENTAFVSGNGIGKPRGFLDYGDFTAAGVSQIGAVEQFDTGVNGGFAASPNAGDVFMDLVYGMKARYRANGVWAMNRTTLGAVRKLKDGDNNFLWQPSFQAGEPATLAGYAVADFEDMPDYTTTGALAIAFGDWAAGYQIVDRQGVRVLRDPYTAKPYVKLYTTKRVGGDVIDFDAIKLMAFQA